MALAEYQVLGAQEADISNLQKDRLTHACILTTTKGMSREEWLQWRRYGIGGSDAAAIAGLNPWKSPVQVYFEKVGGVSSEAGEAAYWGTVLEEPVAKAFRERTGLHVRRRNAMLVNPEYPYMLADIDRLVTVPGRGHGVLEIKTTSVYKSGDWEDGKTPDHYMLQMQHYLAVTGLSFGYFAVLLGGQKMLEPIEVERDDELIQYLTRIEGEFWGYVRTKTPPPLDGSDASGNVLNYLYPPEKATDENEIQLSSEMDAWIQQYIQASEAIKEAEERRKRAANELKAALGTYSIGRLRDHKIAWKPYSQSRFDTKRFAKEHPDLYEQYAKTSEYRSFRIS